MPSRSAIFRNQSPTSTALDPTALPRPDTVGIYLARACDYTHFEPSAPGIGFGGFPLQRPAPLSPSLSSHSPTATSATFIVTRPAWTPLVSPAQQTLLSPQFLPKTRPPNRLTVLPPPNNTKTWPQNRLAVLLRIDPVSKTPPPTRFAALSPVEAMFKTRLTIRLATFSLAHAISNIWPPTRLAVFPPVHGPPKIPPLTRFAELHRATFRPQGSATELPCSVSASPRTAQDPAEDSPRRCSARRLSVEGSPTNSPCNVSAGIRTSQDPVGNSTCCDSVRHISAQDSVVETPSSSAKATVTAGASPRLSFTPPIISP